MRNLAGINSCPESAWRFPNIFQAALLTDSSVGHSEICCDKSGGFGPNQAFELFSWYIRPFVGPWMQVPEFTLSSLLNSFVLNSFAGFVILLPLPMAKPLLCISDFQSL
jgi:hypothetical protein